MKKPRPSLAVDRSLRKLGGDIRTARLRRSLSMKVVAERAGIGLSTMGKIERGDPAVSMGNYAAVLFAVGAGTPFADIMDPTRDEVGLTLDLERLPQRARGRKLRTLA
ncbi:helix-turn-helix domain-containing protein [Desulfovibrio sp. OttesenSCG-928-F20]|nr:helix-turn-helix domain-containing protein [Desulfovibrio sp. OttesenSCG-928-F20]